MDAWETCVSLLPIGKKELACLLYWLLAQPPRRSKNPFTVLQWLGI